MNGFSPNAYTYGIVVIGLCSKGFMKEASDILKEMKEAGFESNTFIFGSYINGLCSNGYTDSAFWVLKMLKRSDIFSYSSVIRGFVKELKLEDAESVFFIVASTMDLVPIAAFTLPPATGLSLLVNMVEEGGGGWLIKNTGPTMMESNNHRLVSLYRSEKQHPTASSAIYALRLFNRLHLRRSMPSASLPDCISVALPLPHRDRKYIIAEFIFGVKDF